MKIHVATAQPGGPPKAGHVLAGAPSHSPLEIPDRNLKLALLAALFGQKILPKPSLAKLRKEHRPDVELEDGRKPSEIDYDYEYNDNLAAVLAKTEVTAAQLARLREVVWPETFGLCNAIYPQDDGEGDEFYIGSLRGLEHCANLETLCLGACVGKLSDVGPLADLTRLRSLAIGSGAEMTNLAPFGKLTNLRDLALDGPFRDLAPLRALTRLEKLSLEGIRARDLSPLAELPELKWLKLTWHADGERTAPTRKKAQALVDQLAARAVELEIAWPWRETIEPRPLAKIEPKTARDPELELRLAADPDDTAAYQAYAEWLRAEGDPRGELIGLDLQLAKKTTPELTEARRAHFVRHKPQLLGPFAHDSPCRFVWKLGFIHRAVLVDDVTAAQLTKLLSLPTARLLQELEMPVTGTSRRTIQALADADPAPPLRALTLQTGGSMKPLDCSPLWKTYRGLRRLSLDAPLLPGAIELPEAVEVDIKMESPSAPVLRSVARATWPKLERLTLWGFLGEDADIEELGPLLAGRTFPRLRSLVVYATGTNELCAALVSAKIVAQLERLEITGVDRFGVSSVEAPSLIEHADRFRHLEAFLFPIGEVTAEERRALRALRRGKRSP